MIGRVCVCGAGTMGSGIAQVAAMAGYQTLLYDLAPEATAKARSAIEKSLQGLREKNRISASQEAEVSARISFVHDPRECIADLVIEAIVEKPEIKEALFIQLAAANQPGTLLTSNTSSLSLSLLADKIPDPGRFAGMHFFNPAPLMKLVELVATPLTNKATIETLTEVSRRMGKVAVTCRDSPGFIVNRVARPFYLEGLRLLEGGLSDIGTIDSLLEASGFRMGPFRLMDLIGNDINYAVSCSVYEALGRPDRMRPSHIQEQKVQSGELGRKTGKGYYSY